MKNSFSKISHHTLKEVFVMFPLMLFSGGVVFSQMKRFQYRWSMYERKPIPSSPAELGLKSLVTHPLAKVTEYYTSNYVKKYNILHSIDWFNVPKEFQGIVECSKGYYDRNREYLAGMYRATTYGTFHTRDGMNSFAIPTTNTEGIFREDNFFWFAFVTRPNTEMTIREDMQLKEGKWSAPKRVVKKNFPFPDPKICRNCTSCDLIR